MVSTTLCQQIPRIVIVFKWWHFLWTNVLIENLVKHNGISSPTQRSWPLAHGNAAFKGCATIGWKASDSTISPATWSWLKPFNQWQRSFHLKAALSLVKRLATAWGRCKIPKWANQMHSICHSRPTDFFFFFFFFQNAVLIIGHQEG